MNEYEALKIHASKSPRVRFVVKKIMDWREDQTLIENARRFNVSRVSAEQFKMRYGLKTVTKRGKPGRKTNRTQAYLVLKKSGWTYEEIGKAFNRTRQAVEQSLSRRDFVASPEGSKYIPY